MHYRKTFVYLITANGSGLNLIDMYLAQTNLEVDTKKEYVLKGYRVYLTTNGSSYVLKEFYDIVGRECSLYKLKKHEAEYIISLKQLTRHG